MYWSLLSGDYKCRDTHLNLFCSSRKYANEKLTVRCGDWDTTKDIEALEHQERPVLRRTIHPLFNNKSLFEDFAVLHLEREFDLQSHIGPACLWDGDKTEIIKSGCVATGWGKDRWGNKGRHQTILKQVEFDLVNNADCQVWTSYMEIITFLCKFCL